MRFLIDNRFESKGRVIEIFVSMKFESHLIVFGFWEL